MKQGNWISQPEINLQKILFYHCPPLLVCFKASYRQNCDLPEVSGSFAIVLTRTRTSHSVLFPLLPKFYTRLGR